MATFGFKLMEPGSRSLKKPGENPIKNPVQSLKAVIGTMLDAHDNYHISQSKGDYDRTIGIPTGVEVGGVEEEIKTTDFDITQEESTKFGSPSNGGFAVTSGRIFLRSHLKATSIYLLSLQQHRQMVDAFPLLVMT